MRHDCADGFKNFNIFIFSHQGKEDQDGRIVYIPLFILTLTYITFYQGIPCQKFVNVPRYECQKHESGILLARSAGAHHVPMSK